MVAVGSDILKGQGCKTVTKLKTGRRNHLLGMGPSIGAEAEGTHLAGAAAEEPTRMLSRATCWPSSPFTVLGTTSAESPKLPDSSDSMKSLPPK